MTDNLKTKSFGGQEEKSDKKTISTNNIKKKSSKSQRQKSKAGIPKPVADRMVRRIAFTTGLPTLSGMGVFIGSYLLVSKGIADIPPGITLISSAGCFIIGLIGLSFGVLSASWDKEPGSFLGIENIRPNFGRMLEAFKQ